jgi:hypothetical protein
LIIPLSSQGLKGTGKHGKRDLEKWMKSNSLSMRIAACMFILFRKDRIVIQVRNSIS